MNRLEDLTEKLDTAKKEYSDLFRFGALNLRVVHLKVEKVKSIQNELNSFKGVSI